MEDSVDRHRSGRSILDAAHALSLQRRRNLAVKKLRRRRSASACSPPPSRPLTRSSACAPARDYLPPDLQKLPLSPRKTCSSSCATTTVSRQLERDLLTIVDEEAPYFIRQIETKNHERGLASWVHREILNAIDLPQEIHLEFLVRHNQVVRPTPEALNPYHVG